MRRVSRRVVERRVHAEGEPVAFLEDLIDFVFCPLSESRRPAGAQGAPALRTALFFGTGLPACEAHGMALDVLQRIRDGEETPDQMPGINGAVVDGLFHVWNGWWSWRSWRMHA